ncbi:hypothetical protein [Streptomyces sp. NPDC007369]|uniref:hypothetical protein n=1 Tax=Streptomyces sp. NPDC007369 TaxID=3154589 RepID=UPI0033EF8C80
MMNRRWVAAPKSRGAILRAVHDWLLAEAEDDRVSPVLVVLTRRPEDRAALFDQAVRLWRERVSEPDDAAAQGAPPGVAHPSARRPPPCIRWTADGKEVVPGAGQGTVPGDGQGAAVPGDRPGAATAQDLLTLARTGEAPAGAAAPRRGLLVVDDLDQLRYQVARSVEEATRPRSAPGAAGVRLLIGAAPDSEVLPEAFDPRTQVLTPAHIHPRTAAHDRIVAWAHDPGAPEVMLVTGPSGAGKTVLLRHVLDTLEIDGRVDVAFALLRDGESDLRPLTTPALAAGVTEALGRAGVAVRPGITLEGSPITTTATDVHGTVTGAHLTFVSRGGVPDLEDVLSLLRNRPGPPAEQRQLLVVVDALNEVSQDRRAEIGGLQTLIGAVERGGRPDPAEPGAGLKVLLSSTDTPTWLRGHRHVELSGPEVNEEIRTYALGRLEDAGQSPAARRELADRVVRDAAGLFLVAAGDLDVWEETGVLPDASGSSAPSALHHFQDRFDRLRKAVDESRDEQRRREWEAIARFLTIAALFPQGLTKQEFRAVWTAGTGETAGTADTGDTGDPGAPGETAAWPRDLLETVASGPARHFLVLPSQGRPGARIRLRHASLRDAVLAGAEQRWNADGSPYADVARLVPRPGVGMTDELERFIVALTPLQGGPGWDRERRPLPLAFALDVLTRLLRFTLLDQQEQEQNRQWDKVTGWLRALLEDWSWWDAFVGAQADAELPLGLPWLVHRLGELVELPGFDPHAMVLWPEGLPPVEALEVPEAAARPGPRPGPKAAAAKSRPVRPHYATVDNPSIQAIVQGTYLYSTRTQAADHLRAITTTFTQCTKLQALEEDPDVRTFWITGFALTPEDEARGARGNYARVWTERLDTGWTLRAERIVTDIGPAVPPRPPHDPKAPRYAPDWGHPVLRRVRRNDHTPPRQPYPSWGAAQRDLDILRSEFPTVAIPIRGRLFIMIWEKWRRAQGRSPVVKHVLTIEACEGGYVISTRDKEPTAAASSPADGGPA